MKKLIFNIMLLPILEDFLMNWILIKVFKIVNPDLLSTNITISVEKRKKSK